MTPARLGAIGLIFVATATAFYYRYQLRAQQLRGEKQQREAERQRLELEKTAAVAEGQRKVAESEMKLLRSQLNPHFLFNAMNSINRYILSNEREKASEYLGQFAQLGEVFAKAHAGHVGFQFAKRATVGVPRLEIEGVHLGRTTRHPQYDQPALAVTRLNFGS